ncbi:MAG: transposase [Streptosporangiaceae bacterium]
MWATNLPERTRGWRGQPAYIDAAHRVHARVEDAFRTGKDTGIGRFASQSFAINTAWLAAALIAATLPAWLRLIALDGDLARAEPKTLRYRVLHASARLTRGSRHRRLKISASWPWAQAIAAAWARITALPQAP